MSTLEWTEERINRLRQLWNEGKSASQIADILGGATRNAVIGKAHRLGLAKRPSPIKRDPNKPPKPRVKKVKPAPKPVDGVTILELTEQMCRWPIGHPGDEDFRFCGARVMSGFTYCAEHCSLAYQTGTKRGDQQDKESA